LLLLLFNPCSAPGFAQYKISSDDALVAPAH